MYIILDENNKFKRIKWFYELNLDINIYIHVYTFSFSLEMRWLLLILWWRKLNLRSPVWKITIHPLKSRNIDSA